MMLPTRQVGEARARRGTLEEELISERLGAAIRKRRARRSRRRPGYNAKAIDLCDSVGEVEIAVGQDQGGAEDRSDKEGPFRPRVRRAGGRRRRGRGQGGALAPRWLAPGPRGSLDLPNSGVGHSMPEDHDIGNPMPILGAE
jgi:hypothetical protein